jgi:hypothetical protein
MDGWGWVVGIGWRVGGDGWVGIGSGLEHLARKGILSDLEWGGDGWVGGMGGWW